MFKFKICLPFISIICPFFLCAAPQKIEGFENAILDDTAEVKAPDAKWDTKRFTDGDLTNENETRELSVPNGSVITINPKIRVETKGFQIFSGNVKAKNNPSGTCAVKSMSVEGFVNGKWVELIKEENIPDYDEKAALSADSFFYRFDFPEPVSVDSLKISIIDSHDTGIRKSGAAEKRMAIIREIQLFSTTPTKKQFSLSELVKAEYALPVYRNSKEAKLTIIVADSPRAPKKAELAIFSPENKEIYKSEISLNIGENTKSIDISALKNGRYATFLKTDACVYKRLLRIDNIPEIGYPEKPLRVAGKKFFFTPDKFTFKYAKKVSVKVSQAKAVEIARQPDENHLAMKSEGFYRTTDGNFVMEVVDYKYRDYFTKPSGKRILISKNLEGPYKEIEALPKNRMKPEPLSATFRPDAPLVKFPKGGPEKIKYELYNKEKHGEIPANNVSVVYSYKSQFLDFIKKPLRASWCVGKTAKGEWVLFSKTPLFKDVWRLEGDKYDDGWQTNDNFVGKWMSFKEGENELFFAQGQTLRRDPPYNIPYDNIAAFRYLALYSTTNGLDWKFRNYLDVPSEKDARGAQHYGGYLLQMKNADLGLLYILAYDGAAQQIYLDLRYTRNGVHFYPFPNSKPFLRTFNPDDWYFGHVFIGRNIYRVGDKFVQEITRGSNALHFTFEAFLRHNKLSEITADTLIKRLDKRRFKEDFTFFNMLGGYEGIAALCRKLNFSAGALTFRPDGWFAVSAGDEEGSFATNMLRGAKEMAANYEVENGGYIDVALKDADNNVIETKRLAGDSLKSEVFKSIPAKEFYLEVKMRNAKIYALYFK